MSKDLVSVKRDGLDSQSIQGFILCESDRLVVLHYISDFKPNGIVALSREDISSIESTDTDKFQSNLLENEGITEQINFSVKYSANSWHDFFKSAIDLHDYFIIEEERLEVPEFTIGSIVEIREKSLDMKYFTGVARWLEELKTLNYSEITCCQMDNSYLNAYERYFEAQDT